MSTSVTNMTSDTLPRIEIQDEVARLLGPEVLEWWKTKDGIDWHHLDKNTSHVYGIYAAMLEHLVDDAEKRGMRPGYIIGYLALRIWGSGDNQTRNDIKKIIPNFDMLDHVFLDDEMERRVKAHKGK